jgi:hypothetical protein
MSRKHRASALALLTVLSYGGAVGAQKIELAGRVMGAPLSGQHIRALGDARFVAVSKLSYDGDRAYVEVIDVLTPSAIEVVTTRAVLEAFGRRGAPPGGAGIYAPNGELVFLDAAKAGMFLYDDSGQPAPRRYWYVEIARSTGAVLRSTSLGTFEGDDYLHYIGTDRIQDRAWFWLERYDTPAPGAHGRARGPRQLTLRRIDLQTHAIWDEMSIPLPARPIVTREHFEAKVDVFASDDLSRFAVVEYSESLFHPTPRASVYVLEPRASTWFSVAAPETAYSSAFSRDGKNLYLASAGGSTVTSVDLVAKRIAKIVATPSLPRGLAISPNGSTLFVLGWPDTYAAYDLPSLSNRRDLAHDAGVKAAATKYFGNGEVSRDGTHLVLRERSPQSTGWTTGVGPPTPFVVARIVE